MSTTLHSKIMSTTALALPAATSSQVDMQLDEQTSAIVHQLVTGANSRELGAVPLQLIPLPATDHGLALPDPTPPKYVHVPKEVREYPMPGSRETHEMAIVNENMLVISQQTNSTLVKVQLDPSTGRPVGCVRFCVSDFWAGLHGLYACQSTAYKGQVWATLQFKSILLRINVGEDLATDPKVEEIYPLPPHVNGPHCVCEIGQDLWTGCKDSHHVVRINYMKPEDCTVWPCSGRPIFIAKHGTSNDVYASLDASSKIWRYEHATDTTSEMDIPPSKGTTPVGLIAGPDGNIWFVLTGGAAGGTGTFARILQSGEFQWFTLTTPIGANAGLLHLAFDWDYLSKQQTSNSTNGDDTAVATASDTPPYLRLWLLSSTLLADVGKSIDAVFTVVINNELGRLTDYQQSLALPTQVCWTHRVLPHRTGLFVTQLKLSSLAHIAGSAVVQPAEVPGETTDFYNDFGLGISLDSYMFSEETATRGALLGPASASNAAAAIATTTFRPHHKASSRPKSKRART